MRLADVLLDLAALASASRAVASKHVALRSRQLERYSQSSSIAAAMRQGAQNVKSKQRQAPPRPADVRLHEAWVNEADRATGASVDPMANRDIVGASEPLRKGTPDPGYLSASERSPQGDDDLGKLNSGFSLRSTQANILRELRQREYARSDTPADSSPKPHPLDPRFNRFADKTPVQEAGGSAPEVTANIPLAQSPGVNADVFRAGTVSALDLAKESLAGDPTSKAAQDSSVENTPGQRAGESEPLAKKAFPVEQFPDVKQKDTCIGDSASEMANFVKQGTEGGGKDSAHGTSMDQALAQEAGGSSPTARDAEAAEQSEGINTDIFKTGRLSEMMDKSRGPSDKLSEVVSRASSANQTPAPETGGLTPVEKPTGNGEPADVNINVFRRGTVSTAPGASNDGLDSFQESTPKSQTVTGKPSPQGAPRSQVPQGSTRMHGEVGTTTEYAVFPSQSTTYATTLQPQEKEAVLESQPSQEAAAAEASELGRNLGAATAPAYQLRESKVPSSRLSRLWNYGGLAAGMLGGALSESISRGFGGGGEGSVMLSPGNMERLVSKLSRMRGAALKLGQMISFQDSKMLPGPIQEVMQRVQDRADYMPAWQRDRVLATNLGMEWRDLFESFEETPIAAASIGQVHRAKLRSTGADVAVKIQFPGVADSINSDLDNLGILLTATKLLPKGLYLNKTIDNARLELGWECDYEREAACAQRYRDLLLPGGEDDVFVVPRIYPEACGRQVLTMEYMDGVGVTRVKSFTQAQRDWIGTQILRLCLREITEFHFMQTDPNWTNFLYNAETAKLELLDFGASREYPETFIRLYVRLLHAASRGNKEAIRDLSVELGYLTGHESRAMLEAHTQSVLTLAEPFSEAAPEEYDFRDQTITERVKALIPIMIRERLAPPPEETYSLHRKLSGAFLLCARLGSRVRCRELWERSMERSGLVSKS